MERVEFLHVIETCGDQNKLASERWKDIVHVNISDDKTISAFGTKVANGEVEFVDIPLGAGTESGRLTGFYILEYLAPDAEITFEKPNKRLSFVDCKNIMSLTFANTDKDGKQIYNTIEDFMKAMYNTADLNV